MPYCNIAALITIVLKMLTIFSIPQCAVTENQQYGILSMQNLTLCIQMQNQISLFVEWFMIPSALSGYFHFPIVDMLNVLANMLFLVWCEFPASIWYCIVCDIKNIYNTVGGAVSVIKRYCQKPCQYDNNTAYCHMYPGCDVCMNCLLQMLDKNIHVLYRWWYWHMEYG